MNAVLKPQANELLQAALPHEAHLRAVLWRFTRNQADVEDLLQETYIRLLSKPQYTGGSGFVATIARHLAIDWLRHKQVLPLEVPIDLNQLEHLDERSPPERIVGSQEELQRTLRAVNRLSPQQRGVLVLRRVYGYSQAEIAQRLNIEEHTVETHLQRAVHALTLILGARP